MKKIILSIAATAIAALALAIVLASLYFHGSLSPVSPRANPGLKTQTIAIGAAKLSVEVAATAAEQEQGLSDRPSLAPDDGMIFPMAPPSEPPFWMPRMHFPLDFIYLNSGRVVELKDDVSNADLTPFAPHEPVDAVLEVNAGYNAAHSIKVGDAADY
jgi:hypothetical protein